MVFESDPSCLCHLGQMGYSDLIFRPFPGSHQLLCVCSTVFPKYSYGPAEEEMPLYADGAKFEYVALTLASGQNLYKLTFLIHRIGLQMASLQYCCKNERCSILTCKAVTLYQTFENWWLPCYCVILLCDIVKTRYLRKKAQCAWHGAVHCGCCSNKRRLW